MGWCLGIGKMFGIKMDIHWSTILIVYLIVSGLQGSIMKQHPGCSSVGCFAIACIMAITFLASILAHELAHARVGQHFGINFSGIVLFALGGVAKMDIKQMPSARAEFWMASAGPAMSFLIGIVGCLLCLPMFWLKHHPCLFTAAYGYFVTVAFYIGLVNIVLGAFNIGAPFFPLDGGRVLRSIIWAATKNYKLATLWAANIGRIGAGLFALAGVMMAFGYSIPLFGVGLTGGLWLFVIAFFLFMASTGELINLKKPIT